MIAHSLTYTYAGQAEIQPIELPSLTDNKVHIMALFSGISRGTEGLVFNGHVPESEWERMRCPHQRGEFSFPLAYGYCWVGEVIDKASDVENLNVGDRVFVLHPHQDQIVIDANQPILLDKSLPSKRAVLLANMETALNAVWDGEVENCEHVAVIGAGVVGLLTGYVLKALSGVTPQMIDLDKGKRSIVESFGFEFSTPEEARVSGRDYERIFNTSASGAGLQFAIDIAEFEAKVIEMSWFGSKDISLNLGGGFHGKRLQIISSQVGHIAPAKRETHSHKDRMAEAMRLLDAEILDKLLESAIDFKHLPQRLHDMFNGKTGALCHLVQYRD